MTTNDALLFHEKCGTLIKLSNNNKTAERRRPLDEFNNGVVMTNRPLRHNEMFEVFNRTTRHRNNRQSVLKHRDNAACRTNNLKIS